MHYGPIPQPRKLWCSVQYEFATTSKCLPHSIQFSSPEPEVVAEEEEWVRFKREYIANVQAAQKKKEEAEKKAALAAAKEADKKKKKK